MTDAGLPNVPNDAAMEELVRHFLPVVYAAARRACQICICPGSLTISNSTHRGKSRRARGAQLNLAKGLPRA